MAHLLLLRDSRTLTRMHFLHAAAHLGLLTELLVPADQDALCLRLGIERKEQFELLLKLGASLGELAHRSGTYRLKGRRSKALARRNGGVLLALLDEQLRYHGSVYDQLPERLRGAELGGCPAGTAAVVAESARIAEPVISGYVREVVAESAGSRVLDVGCGSGAYLRAVAQQPGTHGMGIDMQPASVERARENLDRWGVGGRFEVRPGDIRDGIDTLDGPYDVVLLLNNIYYFAPEQRIGLFRTLHSALREGGTLVLASMFHGTTPTALNLDLVLACTQGCHALPTAEELRPELLRAGFSQVHIDRLAVKESLLAIRAS